MLNPGAFGRQEVGCAEVTDKSGSNGGDALQREQAERKRLTSTLAHERRKVASLKARLAGLEAAEQTRSADLAQLYMALTLERHPPELSETEKSAWLETAARARVRAEARGGEMDGLPGEPPPQGGLGKPSPGVKPLATVSGLPLRVAVANEATSAFNGCPDPRVIARPLGDPLVEDADVLVFPHAETSAYLQDAERVPEALWARVRDGRTRLVLDGSGEGHPHYPEIARAHHAFLRARGADPSRALYLTQDRGYRADYEAWARAAHETPMRVHVFDSFLGRVVSEFDITGEQVFGHRLARYLRRPARRSRRFLSLTYTPRATKLLFLLRLLRDGLWDQGWVSFAGFSSEAFDHGPSRAGAARRLLALEGFGEEARELSPLIDRLEAMKPQVFMAETFKLNGKMRARAVQAMDLEEYGDSWFSVVTETEMSSRLLRITEKPLKPLLGFHPFLVLGNPGALELLRGYGFQTFSGTIDERYDTESDPRRRFDMVYAEFRRLCALDEAEMARLSGEVSEIVVFNACWGLTELPRRFRQTLVAGLVDQLAPGDTAA